ncbi:amylo-alpha-1,6-glucosidase [Planosporangium thailandense]|uniref:Amylo-alpha-1,6-glucosidase n=1 Tax=Planosporangium thailandense TaxID=765197 RepID=A0ABX0XZR7_9ACTN|nr:amylo-alpha-1,6-glucosidase [Planosporangium thailandense]NJC71392.1 amylo-alpha-1,6-glucosidase [Planosporangium thailandense]
MPERAQSQRATPVYPYPGTVDRLGLLESDLRRLPPELGCGALAVLDGRTFMYSDAVGDIPKGSVGGLVHADTRYLDEWVLTVNGARLLELGNGLPEHSRAKFYLTNPALPGLTANALGVCRQRVIDGDVGERIELTNHDDRHLHLTVRLAVGSDFADLFEIKEEVGDRSTRIRRDHLRDGSRLRFSYRHDIFSAATEVQAVPAADRIDGEALVWEVDLPVHGTWSCDLYVVLPTGDEEITPPQHRPSPAMGMSHDPVSDWRDRLAHFHSDSHLIEPLIAQAVRDLTALRITMRVGDEDVMLPAAGLPWFLTLFGRDTLITAYQTLVYGPDLARGALIALANYQGTRCDDMRDEEPGKILHEVRTGELTKLGLRPHSPYYGSADATPLWLILLSEYWRWTGDDKLVQQLYGNAMAAMEWIDHYGDRDGDCFVEYQTHSPEGLGNQCWRDSWDGVLYADGRIPPLPIATCEIQGYVYDAKLRMAELADGPLDNRTLARRLHREAAQLQSLFNEQFWIDDRGGYYALGLDGDKRRIDAMTSNMGHLLWSGIIPDDRARIVVDQLMSEQLFSGWGVRTMATTDAGYNPIGYHRGTVWPHDNSIIAYGMTRYGYREQAKRLAVALAEAATHFDHRLPEAICGYPRANTGIPIAYPTACSPQSWASATPLLFTRALYGVEPCDGRLTIDPDAPESDGHVQITGLTAFGIRWDIDATGRTGAVRPAPPAPC